MKIINASYEIITPIDRIDILRRIESAGRVCYKSEDKITETSCSDFVRMLIKRGHEAMIEHYSLTVKFICDRAIANEIVRHRLASYCLTGDTILRSYVANPRHQGKQWTIEQLYSWQTDIKRKGRLQLINLRSVDEKGIIIPNKIKSIVCNGEENIYQVTTKTGRIIKSTLNHRYYTPNGYFKLEDLKVGSRIYANGLPALENPEYLFKRYIKDNLTRKELAKEIGCCESYVYRAFIKFGIRKPLSDRPNRKAGYGKPGILTLEQRKKISERMKGENNPAWKGDKVTKSGGYTRSNKIYSPDICWGCGTTENLERHHYDLDPTNNDSTNLYFACQKCHKAFHHLDIKTIFSDEIIDIKYAGKEIVYDIEMVNDPHNFVANGLVVHNSQSSTRYCNYSKDKFDNEITVIKPCFFEEDTEQYIWWLYAMRCAEAAYMALLKIGAKPEEARSVLPNSLMTELVMTANLREWRHFFKLRTSKAAHPQMRELTIPLLAELKEKLPEIFEDIEVAA